MPKTRSKAGSLSRQRHAEVSWCAEDILELRPGWTVKQCSEFLMDNDDYIQCAMVESGWAAIADLLRWEENE